MYLPYPPLPMKNVPSVEVYNSTDVIPLETPVIHPANALDDKEVGAHAQTFHAKLLEMQEVCGNRLPVGFLQRYGLKPLHEYIVTSQSTREAMMKAIENEIALNSWRLPDQEPQTTTMMELSDETVSVQVDSTRNAI